ncbi:response regulator [Sulfitobacter sp. JBTF-M27]|uniref:Response regulator n=1 Tax=Sulfitobacter sediminilitoris TaxID=2698830 RepID=A0A6P0CBN4_9RHOB|nr:response regulator transcription factor [Sulfitobacter sediminilitoris]NEK21893.1 response regulator [Sulfitobacter sediminilitoris]
MAEPSGKPYREYMGQSNQHRFIIADDHRLIASGLAVELKLRGHNVEAIVDNGLDAISMIKRLQPDCAILDINMPGANGAEVFLEAKRWSPKTQFAILTAHPSATLFANLVEAGVNGIFLKSDDPAEICSGIARVLKGQTVLSPSVITIVTPQRDMPELTNRELQVPQGIAKGLSNAAMADDMGISSKTVDTHRTNLMKKLSVHSSAMLLMKAIKLGLISVDG